MPLFCQLVFWRLNRTVVSVIYILQSITSHHDSRAYINVHVIESHAFSQKGAELWFKVTLHLKASDLNDCQKIGKGNSIRSGQRSTLDVLKVDECFSCIITNS